LSQVRVKHEVLKCIEKKPAYSLPPDTLFILDEAMGVTLRASTQRTAITLTVMITKFWHKSPPMLATIVTQVYHVSTEIRDL
jgi:hypothetical protein